jgi:hypothetical protein
LTSSAKKESNLSEERSSSGLERDEIFQTPAFALYNVSGLGTDEAS